jgi:hypothetical protein
MKDEEIETMVNKIGEVAPDQVANFLANPEAFDYSVLEGYSDFTDKYKSIADFVGDKNAIKAQIWNNLNGKFPSDARFQSLQEQYPWLNKEDLKEWFDKTNEYKEFYKAEAEKEANKNLRKKEVQNDWLLRSIIASDYEKQRYIDDPNSALFGEQAPSLGDAPATRWGSIGDLGAGVLGAAGDALPGAYGMAGPVIRAARDVTHKLADSPYQKDWSTIGKDIAVDAGINGGAWLLANARKTARGASEMANTRVQDLLNVTEEGNNIRKGLQTFKDNYLKGASDYKLSEIARSLPNSQFKNDLLKITETSLGKPINHKKLQEMLAQYSVETMPVSETFVRTVRQNDIPLGDNLFRHNTGYLDKVSRTPALQQLTPKEKFSYLLNKVVPEVNKGKLGQAIVQETATIPGRGSRPNVVETSLRKAEQDATIDRIIANYSLLWNKDKEPIEAKSNPVIKAAWKKWSEE